jgi:hypothetical protein
MPTWPYLTRKTMKREFRDEKIFVDIKEQTELDRWMKTYNNTGDHQSIGAASDRAFRRAIRPGAKVKQA